MSKTIEELAAALHAEKCSCVIYNGGAVTFCRERGVKDLMAMLKHNPVILSGAMIADKVIGKGAAALMILGKVKTVYADVISQLALDLFNSVHTDVTYGTLVPNIINRSGTGLCPVESLCSECTTAEECLPLIEKFISEITTQNYLHNANNP